MVHIKYLFITSTICLFKMMKKYVPNHLHVLSHNSREYLVYEVVSFYIVLFITMFSVILNIMQQISIHTAGHQEMHLLIH